MPEMQDAEDEDDRGVLTDLVRLPMAQPVGHYATLFFVFYRANLFIFMHLFSPRHSSNRFGSAFGLSKTFIFMHLFSPQHSSNRFGSAFGLSKTFIFRICIIGSGWAFSRISRQCICFDSACIRGNRTVRVPVSDVSG